MKVFLILFCLFVSGISPVFPVHAGSTKDLEAELAELRRINEAQAGNLANALNQLQEVLGEFQKLHGQVDQNLHQNDQQAKIIQDNQRRLETLEERSQHLVTQLEEIKAAGLLKDAQVKRLDEFKTYQTALTKLNAEQYKEAVQALKTFLAANPKSPYAAGAQYWIGESYFSMRDFPAAVAEYQKVIKAYPKSGKIAASLLKQGFAFFEMQSLAEAKAFLTKLVAQYPGSAEASRAFERIREIDRLLELKAKQAVENKANS